MPPNPPPPQAGQAAPAPTPVPTPARPVSPVGSLYAMSDDEEGEYNTITHTETGRGVKLLYSKSKVSDHFITFLPKNILSSLEPFVDR